jgi:predicted transcriptional regulator
MTQIVLNLPPELHDALQHLAGRDEAAIADILRDALRKDLRRRTHARATRIAEVLGPLRFETAGDFANAIDWHDLHHRLMQAGYRLTRCGGGLSLQNFDGQHVCRAADLGHSHAQLTRRFGRPFPATMVQLPLAS